ncbi:MAG TPA: hypothetical protein VFS05_15935 [Gemmatimonadaceae bacterium]|nr:hypothetical protein [Gemmatimonadaceae bacterium]
MALICREVVERIEETVWEPVEEWVERREKKCEKRKCKKWCLCCNKWFCWIETFFEKVVTWVAKQVVNLVTRVVCEIVHDVIVAVVDTIIAAVNILVDIGRILWNLVTLDWDELLDALKDLLSHITDLGPLLVKWLRIAVAIGTFGLTYVAGYIRDQIDEWRLRNYIRDKLDRVFAGDPDRRQAIKDAIHLDHGPFGLEFDARSIRTFVDSRTRPATGGPPTLWTLHDTGAIDLFELTGVSVGNIIDRPRVEAYLVEGEMPMDADDINAYLASDGEEPHFRVYAFTPSAETEKLTVAQDKGRQVGLKLRWKRSTCEVTGMDQMDVNRTQLSGFLTTVLQRASDGSDVCRLAAAGVFNITDPVDGRHPFGWTKTYSPTSQLSGLMHRDRRPPEFMKYVLIHECGHYFSLVHDGHDGLDKIMWSPVANGWWSWNLILEFLVWSGEPRFTLDDGKKVWDFLIDTIPQCLPGGPRAATPSGPVIT